MKAKNVRAIQASRCAARAPAGWLGPRQRLLIVGCGDVARRALPWLAGRLRIMALARNSESANALRRLGVRPIRADLDLRRSLSRLSGLSRWIWHFAPPSSHGGSTDARTRALSAALLRRRSGRARSSHDLSAARQPGRLCYISTTGVYGDCGGARVPETRPLAARNARALRRVDAERWLRALARRGMAVSVLRTPGIYAADRLPLERLHRADPVLCAEEDVYTNHIHAEDLARLAWLALHRARAGRVFNACDDTRLKMGDYFDRVADRFGLPRPPRVSRAEAAQRLTPLTLSFMSESRQLDNTRIRRELRARLRFPDIDSGLRAVKVPT